MTIGIRSNDYVLNPRNPANSVGKKERSIRYRKTILTGAGANTLHILAGPFTFDSKINSIYGANPALTTATTNDLGFYKVNDAGNDFVPINTGNELWSNITLAAAVTYRDLLLNFNSSLNTSSNVGALLGKGNDQEPIGGVYLGLLIKIASTAATAFVDWEVCLEEATTK